MLEQNTRSPLRPLIITATLILAGVAVIYFFAFPSTPRISNELENGENPLSDPSPEVNSPAPDFNLQSVAGETIRLSDLRGQPVLINFWATWCAPCRIEMPALQDRFETYSEEGFAILAVDFDEPAEAVLAFGEEFGLTFDLLLDPGGKIQDLFRIRGYPTSFFLDEQGVIKVVHIGVMTEGQLDGYLAEVGLGN
ncbi:MAG: redoxin domain-containing protein [Chloroflexi bacterium]|nr:redoxin domain-containing protein [Chloroflexota bacterium]